MGTHIIPRPTDTRDILDAVRRIVRTLHEASRASQKTHGLSGAQLFVLQTLADSPGLSLNALADRTHTHQSSVSTVVSRLAEHGLVLRAAAADDGRRLELRVSAEGRRLAARAPGAAQARLIEAIARLPAGRRRTLARALHELTTTMELTGRAPVMFFDNPDRKGRRVTRG
ncbi:MAG TPA: MarR family transcriptional regulator [Vicinamibacterales bacterium]|jgi:DNA-binding MarR family transcriptional regulator